jgi:hypothetical protein
MQWYVLDENNNPVLENNPTVASVWLDKNLERCIVAQDNVDVDVMLSTVFLGLNHSFIPNKVLIYESLWFGGPFDGEMKRYSNKEDALSGHEKMLQQYKDLKNEIH